MADTIKTASQVSAAKPSDKPYKMSAGDGLYLYVTPAGTKSWRLNYRYQGKQQTTTFGKYPEISLSDARRLRAQFNPEPQTAGRTLESVFKEFVLIKKSDLSIKHQRLMHNRCAPVLAMFGRMDINSIRTSQFLAGLREIENRSPSVAKKVRSDFSQCYVYAKQADIASQNPLQDLKGALKPQKVEHRPALLNPEEIGKLLKFIDTHPTVGMVTRLYLKILPCIFTRPGELRKAEWKGINLETREWHYKMGKLDDKEHIVPLSSTVLNFLAELRKFTGHTPYLFASVPNTKPISDMTANQILRRSGWSTVHSLHGWRATARTLLVERHSFPVDIVEHQLGHTVRTPLGRAYDRTEFLEERHIMLEQWSRYLYSL